MPVLDDARAAGGGTVTIRLEGAEALIRKITTLAQLKSMGAAVRAAAVLVRGKIAHYPQERHDRNDALYGKSDKAAKMRRGFFYHLRHGDIRVPYARGSPPGSKKLGGSWTIEGSNAGLTQTVGTNVSYARLVQGPELQTAYHKTTGWKTTDTVANEERKTVIDYLWKFLVKLVGA